MTNFKKMIVIVLVTVLIGWVLFLNYRLIANISMASPEPESNPNSKFPLSQSSSPDPSPASVSQESVLKGLHLKNPSGHRTDSATASSTGSGIGSGIGSIERSTDEKWKEFAEHFGQNLQPKFTSAGSLISIQGEPGQGSRADDSFTPTNDQKVTERAQEILAAAEDLLKSNSEFPWVKTTSQVSPLSAQVYFNETYHGIPLTPVGDIKIDLGPHGELIRLDSNSISNLTISNESRLSSEQAMQSIKSEFDSGKKNAIRIEGGNPTIWVNGSVGRFGYQFSAGGERLIVDAENGEILSRKNRRVIR